MQKRIPKIIDDLVESLGPTARLDARWGKLSEALVSGGAIDFDMFIPESSFWSDRLVALKGADWRDLSFFELEFLFYLGLRSIGKATDSHLELFKRQREEALQATLKELRTRYTSEPFIAPELYDGLMVALLGNKADLSQLNAPGPLETSSHLVVDHRCDVVRRLKRATHEDHIVILADNAGSELCFDLFFIDTLLTRLSSQIELHVKNVPMFVSDALVSDVMLTIDGLCQQQDIPTLSRLGTRLSAAVESGALRIYDPVDWSEPRSMNQLSSPLAQSMRDAQTVISKGDLNYRRFFEDRAWDSVTPVSEASVADMPWAVALRVLKSDCVVGVPPGQSEGLFKQNPEWRSCGGYSIVQRVDRAADREQPLS